MLDVPCSVTSNSSQARPGTFISACSRSKSVRLELLHSPEVEGVANADVLRIAATATDADSSDHQIQEASNVPQPVAVVPTRLAADALDRRERLSRGTIDVAVRESTIREPNRTPPHFCAGPDDESASDQRVSAISWSSLVNARATASRRPRGRTRNVVSARLFDTSVGFRRLSTSLRPMRA